MKKSTNPVAAATENGVHERILGVTRRPNPCLAPSFTPELRAGVRAIEEGGSFVRAMLFG